MRKRSGSATRARAKTGSMLPLKTIGGRSLASDRRRLSGAGREASALEAVAGEEPPADEEAARRGLLAFAFHSTGWK